MTVEEFFRLVSARRVVNSPVRIAETAVARLKVERPELERAATREHGDPSIFPEKLSLWLSYVQFHWNDH